MNRGPPCLQPHAGKFKFAVNCAILICYGLLMPDLISVMNEIVKDLFHEYVNINQTLSIVGISVLLLPVYLTRRMKLLSRLASAGNIVLLVIFIISFQYLCQDIPDISTRPAVKRIDYLTLTSYTNDVMCSYNGIAMVLPVRDRMKSKKNFDGWNGLLGLALAIIISSHVACGFYGYLKFGEMTQVNYILNLPEDNWLYKSLKILSFISVYCTIGTVVFVVVEIIWAKIKDIFSMEFFQNYGEYICRVMLLIFSCIFTLVVPELQLLMSLTGCIGAFILTCMTPSIITILVLYGEEEPTLLVDKVKRKCTLICCVLILMFGIYSLIAGIGVAVYTTLYHIIL